MRKRITVGIAVAAVGAAGTLAAFSLAEGDTGRELAEPVLAPAITPDGSGGAAVARGKGRRPRITTFFSQDPTPVPPEGVLQRVKCPRGEGSAVGAGARTDSGITISYLSRALPDGRTPRRSYVIGFDDVSDTNREDAGAFAEVQCAKRIAVP